MLSSRNEMIAVGALILYLAFVPGLQVVREILSTSVGKAVALAGIIYVHKYVSCSLALLLVVGYLRSQMSAWEGFETPTTTVDPTPTCPDGYAYDAVMKKCQVSSAASPSIPPTSGASVNMPPPNSTISTAPMTTPRPTMPPANPPPTMGGVQPASGSSSSVAHV